MAVDLIGTFPGIIPGVGLITAGAKLCDKDVTLTNKTLVIQQVVAALLSFVACTLLSGVGIFDPTSILDYLGHGFLALGVIHGILAVVFWKRYSKEEAEAPR